MIRSLGLAGAYAAVIGVALTLLGILGFFSNPIIGDAAKNPIFVTGTIHSLVILITGALGIYVALGLKGDQQVIGVAGIGVLYLALFVLTLVNGTLFDTLNYPVNAADRVLHLGIAVSALAVAWYQRSSAGRMITAR